MFSLYSSWDDYESNSFMADEDNRNVSLSSVRPLSNTVRHIPTIQIDHVDKPDMFKESLKLDEQLEPAVEIRQAVYHHKGKKSTSTAPTLRGIDVCVPTGGIYGLLGPSGCGKTTLLRCLVGRIKPHSGSVKVLGNAPGSEHSLVPGPDIGYMPQELALFPEFTIRETLVYFARLYRMDEKVTNERIEFLTTFLELPGPDRLVCNLSGGQKRRVSLSVALIQSPPLLILDEPTVGVDPVLREVIWKYLVSLTKDKKITVIITTHYIEEARAADTVGLMRFGRLLTEASPDYLIQATGLPTLEAVFLKLCRLDMDNGNNSMGGTPRPAPKEIEHKKHLDIDNNLITSGEMCLPQSVVVTDGKNENRSSKFKPCHPLVKSFSRTSAMFKKNVTRLRRNLAVLIYQFFLPSFEIILFGLCIGQDPRELPLSIYNAELSSNNLLSTKFIEYVDNSTFIKQLHDSKEDALDAVRSGKSWGALIFDRNFTTALQMRTVLGSGADNATLHQSQIHIHLDLTNKIIGYTMQRSLYETFQSFAKDTLTDLGMNPALADLPIHEEEPIYGTRNPDFTEFMAPGMLLSTAYLAAVGLTALAFVMERKEGLLERSLVAGINPFEFLISHVLTQLLVLSVQLILLLIFIFAVFNIPVRGPIIWIVVLTWLQGACGMAYGLIISSICKDENSATMLALGSMYPNLLLNGTIWPTQAMPKFIRYISYGLPQTLAIESMRYIMSRGWDPSYPEVAAGFWVTIVWTLSLLIAAGFIFKHKA